MRRASAILHDAEQIETIEDLTGVFESIASTQVAKVKSRVSMSTDFFKLLWKRYSALRIDPSKRITERKLKADGKPNVFVVISAEGGLSGDIDLRLIETMLTDYDAKTTDLVVIGSHGAQVLQARKIPYVRYFKVPETEGYINVSPLIAVIREYAKVTVYFEEYVSLGVQNIKKIDLVSTIRDLSEDADSDDVITDAETIFEPSLEVIAEYMEDMMINLALSQVIMESNLAQSASRFNAMAMAKKRAMEMVLLYSLDFHRAKRSESDRRLREVLISLKKKKREARK